MRCSIAPSPLFSWKTSTFFERALFETTYPSKATTAKLFLGNAWLHPPPNNITTSSNNRTTFKIVCCTNPSSLHLSHRGFLTTASSRSWPGTEARRRWMAQRKHLVLRTVSGRAMAGGLEGITKGPRISRFMELVTRIITTTTSIIILGRGGKSIFKRSSLLLSWCRRIGIWTQMMNLTKISTILRDSKKCWCNTSKRKKGSRNKRWKMTPN